MTTEKNEAAGGASLSDDELEVAEPNTYYCSFCGDSSLVAHYIIAAASDEICICDKCVELCRDLIGMNRAKQAASNAQVRGGAHNEPNEGN